MQNQGQMRTCHTHAQNACLQRSARFQIRWSILHAHICTCGSSISSFSIGVTWCGRGLTNGHIWGPPPRCQVRVAWLFHSPVARDGLTDEWPMRGEQSCPSQLAGLLAYQPLPSSGCSWCYSKEERERLEGGALHCQEGCGAGSLLSSANACIR